MSQAGKILDPCEGRLFIKSPREPCVREIKSQGRPGLQDGISTVQRSQPAADARFRPPLRLSGVTLRLQ